MKGNNHPKIFDIYHNMNIGLTQDSRKTVRDYTSSLQGHRRALEITCGTPGNDHPHTADSYNKHEPDHSTKIGGV